MELVLLYGFLKLDTLHQVFGFLQYIFVLSIVGSGVLYYITESFRKDNPEYDRRDPDKRWLDKYITVHFWELKLFKQTIIAWVCLSTLHVLIPTTNQAAVLAGAYYATEVAQSEEGKKVIVLLRKRANKYLDEQINTSIEKSK